MMIMIHPIGFRRPDKDSLSFLVFPYAYIYDLL